ncbi:MAG: integrase arm-type DNA-binding domain-containing protein, partial [Alphaproteobacteria bacterium]
MLVSKRFDTNIFSTGTNMSMSDAKARSLKPRARPYKTSDGEGLHMLVKPNGARLWRFSYRFGGKQKALALGSYPDVSIRDARRKRDDARDQIKDGNDPSASRRLEKIRERVAAGNTFKLVANEWFERQKARLAPSYSDRLRSRLDEDLLPALGERPLKDIEPIEILDALRKVEKRGAPEMARRIMQMASAIFRYGVATARCPRDPTADLRGALSSPKPVKSRAALSASDLPEYVAKLRDYPGEAMTRMALELIALTFVRSSELRLATWSEFEDLTGKNPLWRIPAERMKMKRAHLVPLVPQTIQVLRELRELHPKAQYLFSASTKTGVISENTLIYALYRMGYHGRATVHGFRSTASTILNEQQFNRDWIEMQLAHVDGSVR